MPARSTGLAPSASGRYIWVSATDGNDGHAGASEGDAVKTIQKAVDAAGPGDTVLVKNGTYTNTGPTIVSVSRSGTDGRPITIVAAPNARPTIASTTKTWNAILITGSYVVIQGLTLEGHRDQITESYAMAQKLNTNNPATSGSGITIGDHKARPHHVVIRENVVDKFPGGGISGLEADYVTVERNIVTGNAFYSPYGCSGISFLRSANSDRSTGLKMIIRQNYVADNKQVVPWFKVGKVVDGNAIIIDSGNVDFGDGPYLGKTLIENNVSVNSGGRGVNVFKSDNVQVLNNTTYHNANITKDGEITLVASANVTAAGNVAVPPAGQKAIVGGPQVTLGKNLTEGDPMFVDPAGRDFRLKAGSPGIDAATGPLVPVNDLRGARRPAGAAPDLGAYENR